MEQSRHIAILLPGLYGGGAERAMLNLTQGFAMAGHQVDLVLAMAVGPYLDEIPDGVRLVNLNARRSLTSLPALVRYLRREEPEALISALSRTNLLALWAQMICGRPQRVIVNEQATLSRWASGSDDWRHQITPQLTRRFYHRAHAVVTVSEGVAEDLREHVGLSDHNIRVIYNPVITPESRRKANDAPDHPWFKAGEPPVLLAVGRLARQKDYPTLLEAFALLRGRRSARLLILGEGPLRKELESQIDDLGIGEDVSLPGFVDNPYAYMANASLYVMSSRWEGLPTVLVEALFCGVPIVSTDCPSGPDEILRSGEYGALVPMGEPEVLADTMAQALDGETPRPNPESWQPYTVERITQKYLTLIDSR